MTSKLMPAKDKKKSGLVVLVGRSNAGKSTLLNALVGAKVAITSPKPQTTRQVIHGVLNDERGQIVFADTPGVFAQIPDRLTKQLNKKAREALTGIDAIIYVADPTRHVGKEEQIAHRLAAGSTAPKILALNKSDKNRPYLHEYLAWKDGFESVVEISALRGHNLKSLVDAVLEILPEGEPLYPPEQLTDMTDEFRVQELIREKLFIVMHEEIPYAATVKVEEMAERKNGMLYVRAAIITASPRHKKLIIGRGGQKIKEIGQLSRNELETILDKKVFLDLEVSVEERWQERFA